MATPLDVPSRSNPPHSTKAQRAHHSSPRSPRAPPSSLLTSTLRRDEAGTDGTRRGRSLTRSILSAASSDASDSPSSIISKTSDRRMTRARGKLRRRSRSPSRPHDRDLNMLDVGSSSPMKRRKVQSSSTGQEDEENIQNVVGDKDWDKYKGERERSKQRLTYRRRSDHAASEAASQARNRLKGMWLEAGAAVDEDVEDREETDEERMDGDYRIESRGTEETSNEKPELPAVGTRRGRRRVMELPKR